MASEVFIFTVSGADDIIAAYKSIQTAADKTANVVAKSAQSEARARTAASNRIGATSKAAEEKRWREVERAGKRIEKQFEAEAKAAERAANRRIKAEQKANAESKRALGQLGGKIGTAALGVAALGVAGVGQAARENIRLGEMANRVSINARGHGQKAVDPNTLRKEFENTAIASPGIKSEDVAEGIGTFVGKTGRLDIAREMQGTFATASQASGASYQDIATAAADLFQKFDVNTAEDMAQAFATLTEQGKAGSFEMKDAAAQFSKLSAAADRFNIGKGSKAVGTLGGLTQIARSATGSPEQAATAVEAMFRQLTGQAGKLKAQQVNVFDKNGKARDIQDVLTDTISKVGGNNMEKKKIGLQKVFGEEGIRAISPLISKYEEAFQGTKGTDKEKDAAGQKALRAEFDKAINVEASITDMKKDQAQAQSDASAQLTGAWEQVKSAVGAEAVPAILAFVKQLSAHPEIMDPFIEAIKVGAAALVGFADLLKMLGLVKEKEKTSQQKADEANKKLTEFDKEHQTGPLSPAEQAKRNQLQGEAVLRTEQAKLGSGPQGMSEEEFVKQYAALGGGGEGAKEDAKSVAQSAKSDPRGLTTQMDFVNNMPGLGYVLGETKDQAILRQNYTDQQSAAKNAADAAAKLGSAADKLSQSADSLSKAKPFGQDGDK